MKLSWSRIEKYLLCPKYYYYYYICGYRDKYISSALFFGTKVAEIWQQLLLKKKENLTDEEKKIINKDPYQYFDELYSFVHINDTCYNLCDCKYVRYFESDYDADILTEKDIIDINKYIQNLKINEEVLFEKLYSKYELYKTNEKETQLINYMFWISTKRKAYLLIESYIKNILPLVHKVHGIESKISIENNNGDILEGFLDVDCDFEYPKGTIERTILDHKTSSQKYKESALTDKQQLALYSYSEDINKQGYIVGLKKIKKPRNGENKGKIFAEIQILIGSITNERKEEVLEEADKVLNKIKNEEFCKNYKNGCLVFGRQCAYKKVCSGGKPDYLFIKKGENLTKKWE